MGRLDGKVALISGAARGMGRAFALLFAEQGARVAIADIRDDEGRDLADSIGENALYVRLDVTSEPDWIAAIEATEAAFGPLTTLVNNAGIAEAAPFYEMSLESFRRVTDVLQTGVFLGMKSVVPSMTRAGGGSIINISSIDGLTGMDHIISYVGAKWAVRGMTKTAAREVADRNIRVNSIHPGFIWTPMVEGHLTASGATDIEAARVETGKLHPLGHMGDVDDIAWAVVYLASEESKFMTGSELVVDGGWTAR